MMAKHEHKIRVRYGETDQMGVVYYGNYALYYEVARTEWLRQFDLTYADIERSGIIMPVTEMRSRYFRPARYDDELTLQTYLRDLPGKRITFHTDILNEVGNIVNKGKVTLAFVDMKTRETIGVPRILEEKIGAALK